MNNVDRILNLFRSKSYTIRMGAGKLSKIYKVSKDDVYKARELFYNEPRVAQNGINKVPRIAIVDIETAPMKAFVWSRWKQNIYLDQTISEWFMICWSVKILNGEVFSSCLNSDEAKSEDDKRIVSNLCDVLNNVDIVIAHNGERFDIPKINSRVVINGLPPLKPFQMIDTKKVAARQFGFSSNKLDGLARMFGIETKMDTDFELWVKCLEGDKEALHYMQTYNIKDVEILEKVFLKLYPYLKEVPNLAVYFEENTKVCTKCGCHHLTDEGFYYTKANKYTLYRCSNCGSYSRSRYGSFDGDKKNLLQGF